MPGNGGQLCGLRVYSSVPVMSSSRFLNSWSNFQTATNYSFWTTVQCNWNQLMHWADPVSQSRSVGTRESQHQQYSTRTIVVFVCFGLDFPSTFAFVFNYWLFSLFWRSLCLEHASYFGVGIRIHSTIWNERWRQKILHWILTTVSNWFVSNAHQYTSSNRHQSISTKCHWSSLLRFVLAFIQLFTYLRSHIWSFDHNLFLSFTIF